MMLMELILNIGGFVIALIALFLSIQNRQQTRIIDTHERINNYLVKATGLKLELAQTAAELRSNEKAIRSKLDENPDSILAKALASVMRMQEAIDNFEQQVQKSISEIQDLKPMRAFKKPEILVSLVGKVDTLRLENEAILSELKNIREDLPNARE